MNCHDRKPTHRYDASIRTVYSSEAAITTPTETGTPGTAGPGFTGAGSEDAYKNSGVDVDAGEALVEGIKPAAGSTERSGSIGGLGGFGALFDLRAAGFQDPILVSATDGVGTKLKVAIYTDRHQSVGIDLVAMCVNDLVVQGAEPLFFLDYFATGRLDPAMGRTVVEGIADGCRQAGCALIGGETAEMPGMYSAGDYDLAGFAVGAAERGTLIDGRSVKAGDVILGLASSGVHSNGFSLIRKIVDTALVAYESPAPFDPAASLGELLLTPTRIYVRPLLDLIRSTGPATGGRPVKALAHITGGGLIENIPRSLPDECSAELDAAAWTLPPVFRWLKEYGALTARDLARTFNCGIGMTVVVDPGDADAAAERLRASGETVYRIGTVVANDGGGDRTIVRNVDSHWTG